MRRERNPAPRKRLRDPLRHGWERLWLGGGPLEQLAHATGQLAVAVRGVHELEGVGSPLRAQGSDGCPLQRLESDQRRLLGAEAAAREPAGHTEQDDEADVDDRDRGLVEVVHVLGDELADLVDEQAKSDTAHNRGNRFRRWAEERKRGEQRRQQQETAPEHVRDMQLCAADLRIAGRGEEATREDHSRDRADEQRREMLMQVVAARRPAKPRAADQERSADLGHRRHATARGQSRHAPTAHRGPIELEGAEPPSGECFDDAWEPSTR